ncbi:DUF1499 domain-containing protein [Phormidium pseudopriestleyi FRX01]|uniref:DUF1499 domain-containing protein n=1 Tax=Phormidium pseudopriestleyi FRX01 TaxID=1759528 RepID=A0ABS3FW69_9CYAN|nr:DUF1499 domain-containing protein [Phormidium pseudopriestleyi]MBO0350607.1 DUF1499 domain-containing protein [Phormidium pseudopriestleyi FRX01]
MYNLSPVKVLTLCFSVTLAIWCYLSPTPAAFAAEISPNAIASIFSFSGERPDNLGVSMGKLSPCPTSPNCVSSQAEETDNKHKIEPLQYEFSAKKAFTHLKEIIEEIDNAKVIKSEAHYLYAEFTSSLMGYVDDVEFFLDRKSDVIQVRSASRLGQSDLGVNRKRIEEIRSKFTP